MVCRLRLMLIGWPRYLSWKEAAVSNGEFLLRELRDESGRWRRSWQAAGSPRARQSSRR